MTDPTSPPRRGRHSSPDDEPDVRAPAARRPPVAAPAAPAATWVPSRPTAPAAAASTGTRHYRPEDDDATDIRPFDPIQWADLEHDRSRRPAGGPGSGQHHPLDDRELDETGGLEVVAAHADAHRGVPGHSHDDVHHDVQNDSHDDSHVEHGDDGHGDIGGAPLPARKRRRRLAAAVLSVIVLGGLVVAIVVGGQALLSRINPTAQDFTGPGVGAVEVRVNTGDTLSDIAQTLVEAEVIGSVPPFVTAAEANDAATGIQPGVYRLRSQMNGQAALDLLLDPASRLFSRVTIPEGLTLAATLERLAEGTDTPIAEFQAAATDPAALGLPEYAAGQLEGFLFPATYTFEPDITAGQMLSAMIVRTGQVLDELQIPVDQRLTVLTKASLVQAEASTPEDMAKVARVLENRLADGMPLQLDTTVNYANGKSGITTTPQDRANPSRYNTYVHAGLPPGPISNPGEDALRGVLAPTPGDWRYFVVVDPDIGDTRFAVTAAEHEQNVLLFQQWLRANPEG